MYKLAAWKNVRTILRQEGDDMMDADYSRATDSAWQRYQAAEEQVNSAMGLFLVFLGAYLAIIAQGSNLNQCKHIWSFVVLLILAWLAMAEAIRSFYCKMMANYIAHEYPAILAADVVNTSPWCCRIFGFVTTARVKLKVRNHGSLTGGIHHRTAPNCYMFDDTFECKNSEKELDEGTDTSYYERIPKGQNSVAGFSVVGVVVAVVGAASLVCKLHMSHSPSHAQVPTAMFSPRFAAF